MDMVCLGNVCVWIPYIKETMMMMMMMMMMTNNNNNNNNNIFKTRPVCIHGNPAMKPQAYERRH
jgi:hypothetical protein